MTAVGGLLPYDRSALAAGELWRLLTAHIVHLTLAHALLNAAAAALLWVLFRREYSTRQWLIIVIACIAAIDAGLWFLNPEINWYVGASGVLHGVMAAGALSRIAHRSREGWLLLSLLCAKLAVEQLHGPLPFTTGMPVVVAAHLYGAIGGCVAAIILRPRLRVAAP